MTYLIAVLTVAVFLVSLRLFRLTPAATKAFATSREATGWLRDPDLSEDEKERRMRGASLSLLGGFASISLRGLACVGASLLPGAIGEWFGLTTSAEVSALLLSWEAGVVVLIASAGVWIVRRRR